MIGSTYRCLQRLCFFSLVYSREGSSICFSGKSANNEAACPTPRFLKQQSQPKSTLKPAKLRLLSRTGKSRLGGQCVAGQTVGTSELGVPLLVRLLLCRADIDTLTVPVALRCRFGGRTVPREKRNERPGILPRLPDSDIYCSLDVLARSPHCARHLET